MLEKCRNCGSTNLRLSIEKHQIYKCYTCQRSQVLNPPKAQDTAWEEEPTKADLLDEDLN